MKRPMIIIMFVILTLIIAVYLIFFDTIGIVLMSTDEEITALSVCGGETIAAVTNIGDVYVKGIISNEANYGVNRILQYHNRHSDTFVKIYDKKDAIYVNICDNGGCIITNKSDVYVFINGSEEYKTPTYLCTGYSKAYLTENDLYLLSNDGKFGLVKLNQPDDFIVLGNQVVDFDVEYSDSTYSYGICFTLTVDNHLYVSELGNAIDENEYYIDDIIGFDSISFCADLIDDDKMKKYIEISIVDSSHHAYWYEGDLDESISKIIDKKNYSLVGSNIQRAVAYQRGIAMLDSDDNVAVYGHDFHYFGYERFFTGEVIFYDVKALFSGKNNLILQYQNGNIDFYGYDYSNGKTKFMDNSFFE